MSKTLENKVVVGGAHRKGLVQALPSILSDMLPTLTRQNTPPHINKLIEKVKLPPAIYR